MSHASAPFLLELVKQIAITAFKVTVLSVAFVCKLLALVLDKLATVLQKAVGHGSNH